MSKPNTYLVFAVLIIIQVLFGINFSTSKLIVGKLDPIIWSNIRFLLAGIIMISITILSKRKHPPKTYDFFLPLIPLSLLGMALGQGLFLYGLKYTTSVNTAIITTSIPILTMIVVVVRGQESLTINKFLGVLLALAGVLFIRDLSQVEFGAKTFVGDMLVLLGAFCFALYLSYGKKFLSQYDNLWVTSWMFLISGIAMSIFNIPLWIKFTIPSVDSNFYYSAIYTIVGATLLTYFLNNWTLRRAPSAMVALFIYLQPVVAGIIGWGFLNEEITIRMLVCSLLILSGLGLSLLKVKTKS